jgi:hypothetical protein
MIIDMLSFDSEKYALMGAQYLAGERVYEGEKDEFMQWDQLPPIHEFTNEQAQLCHASIQCTVLASPRK